MQDTYASNDKKDPVTLNPIKNKLKSKPSKHNPSNITLFSPVVSFNFISFIN